MTDSREQIKDRLFRNASRIWGLPETQSEHSFDPLVGMLLGSCAIELEKISNEIEDTRSRVLERLVQLLFPDVMVSALPAHAIAHARPADWTSRLTTDTQLYASRRFAPVREGESPVWKDIYFSPAGAFRLHRMSVRFVCVGHRLVRITDDLTREQIAYADTPLHPSQSHTLWLALDRPALEAEDISVYFETKNEATQSLFYHQLPHARWSVWGQPLTTVKGYGSNAAVSHGLDVTRILKNKRNNTEQTLNHIHKLYEHQYVTIRRFPAGENAACEIPAELRQRFTERDLNRLAEVPVCWVRMDFPEVIHSRMLEDVVVRLNSFPVVNRHLHTLQQRLQRHINIIPLPSDELFLDLSELTDASGNRIHSDALSTEKGQLQVSLRHGGVSRFDSREAARLIDMVIQQLRDESGAYAMLGNDFLNNELQTLQQTLNKLEQQLSSRNKIPGETPYLLVSDSQTDPGQTLFIKYWTTNGTDANQLKAGTPLTAYKGTDLDGLSLRLVTNTQGGRNSLTHSEKVLAYKTALLSKGKLVTQEDIASFCRMRLAMPDALVTIERGIVLAPGRRQSFSKTVDVHIRLHKKELDQLLEKGDRSFWEEDLRQAVEERSNLFMPLRVFIEETLNGSGAG